MKKEKNTNKKPFTRSLTFGITISIAFFTLIICVVTSVIGYLRFTDSLTAEYTDNAFRTAETAATLINPDHLQLYLDEASASTIEDDAEYQLSKERLDVLCQKQHVTLIYVISVNQVDNYNSFFSVFNAVEEGSVYSPWECGYGRKTTNEEYRQKYQNIYEKKITSATVIRDSSLAAGTKAHITFLLGLKKSDGSIAGIMAIQRPMDHLDTGRNSYIIMVVLITIIIGTIIAAAIVYVLRRHFVSPIHDIIIEAKRFANDNNISETRLENISKVNEISELATTINKMEDDIVKYIDMVATTVSDKERMGTELRVASLIQEGSLPSTFPAFPNRSEFDLYASMTPAKEIGGDFYDFFLIDDNHIVLTMADVSGKGIPAALFMMVTKIIIKERALMSKEFYKMPTPSEILTFTNDRICKNNVADMFVTVWLGILEISTGKITYANAGHDDPILCKKGKSAELVKTKHSLIVGGMPNVSYKDFEIQLDPGDTLFLYTDGLLEATDKNNNMFGINKTLEVLSKNSKKSTKDILDSIWQEVQNFIGDAPQFDDLTMLCFKYNGVQKPKILTIEAIDENLDEAVAFVNNSLQELGVSTKIQTQVDTAFEELFINICHYAYEPDKGGVQIIVENKDNTFAITLIDSGKPYNPLEKQDPDITLDAESRNIGGLGIYMAKELMDNISYEYKNGKNILRMEKKID